MKFHAVDFVERRYGPRRVHFKKKGDALKYGEALSKRPDIVEGEVVVTTCQTGGKVADVVVLLDAAANLGVEGPVTYEGETTVIGSWDVKKKRKVLAKTARGLLGGDEDGDEGDEGDEGDWWDEDGDEDGDEDEDDEDASEDEDDEDDSDEDDSEEEESYDDALDVFDEGEE